jgi:hypothetical protein
MSNTRAWIVAAASALCAAYGAGLLYEGFAAEGYDNLLTAPFVDKPAAERAYNRLATNAPAGVRADAARRLAEADPANPESWTAVAYADWLQHRGTLSPAGLAALDRSYEITFFEPEGAAWRIGFALDNWTALTPALREQVLAEAREALRDPLVAPQLRTRLARIRGAEGRLAATLILAGV